MDCISRKLCAALALTLASMTSFVSADDSAQIRNLQSQIDALKNRGSSGIINPALRPIVKDGLDLSVSVEALLFRPTEDGLAYAIETSNGKSRVQNASYKWDWGFRLGTTYGLPQDGWDLSLNWTWFRGKDHKRPALYSSAAFNDLAPTSAPNLLQTGPTPIQTKVKFNVVDLDLGREFFVSKWLTVKPIVGFRGASVRRHFNVDYSYADVSVPAIPKHENYNRYRGVGLRTGASTQWGLGSGVSLFGEATGSMLFGRHHNQIKNGTTNLVNRPKATRAMTDLAVGVRWDNLMNKDSYRTRLQLGWEQHALAGFNRGTSVVALSDVAAQNPRGDFAYSGFVFHAQFDF
jgi:hypothetical protein